MIHSFIILVLMEKRGVGSICLYFMYQQIPESDVVLSLNFFLI